MLVFVGVFPVFKDMTFKASFLGLPLPFCSPFVQSWKNLARFLIGTGNNDMFLEQAADKVPKDTV